MASMYNYEEILKASDIIEDKWFMVITTNCDNAMVIPLDEIKLLDIRRYAAQVVVDVIEAQTELISNNII